MSDQNPVAPSAPAAPSADVGGIAKQVKKLREAFGDMTLEKFKGRLDEERTAGTRAAIKALGVPKEQRDEVLSKLGEYQLVPKAKEGSKSYDEITKAASETEALRAKVEKHQTYFKQVADSEFEKLPEPIQKDLARRKISDPEAVLDEIRAMKESGLLDALAGAKAPEPKPSTTAAPPGPSTKEPAPADAMNHLQRYEELKKVNRLAAARYRQMFGNAIERVLQSKSK